jgi:hypothetical protein
MNTAQIFVICLTFFIAYWLGFKTKAYMDNGKNIEVESILLTISIFSHAILGIGGIIAMIALIVNNWK